MSYSNDYVSELKEMFLALLVYNWIKSFCPYLIQIYIFWPNQ